MRKIKQLITHGKMKQVIAKCFMVTTLLVVLPVSLCGCGFLKKIPKSERMTPREQSDEMMQNILDALEAKDAQAIKDLFSTYALEESADLDASIDELIDYYKGYDGDFSGNVGEENNLDHKNSVYLLDGMYRTNIDGEEYRWDILIYRNNDEEPDKVGLYKIEIMSQDASDSDCTFKTADDAPGVYIQE